MDESPKSEEKYDLGEIRVVFAKSSITGGKNMFLAIPKQMKASAVNVLLKSRVRENLKHGSVGAFIASELKANFMENKLWILPDKLYKVGAIILRNTRRIRFLLSSNYPKQDLFLKTAQKLNSA